MRSKVCIVLQNIKLHTNQPENNTNLEITWSVSPTVSQIILLPCVFFEIAHKWNFTCELLPALQLTGFPLGVEKLEK